MTAPVEKMNKIVKDTALVQDIGNVWKCSATNKCIRFWRICNEQDDCTSGEDEVDCEFYCDKGRWKCWDKSQCIAQTQLCDHVANCPDNSDENEVMCQNLTCADGQEKCKDGHQCITTSH